MKYKGEKIPLKELIIGVHKLTLHRIPWTSFSWSDIIKYIGIKLSIILYPIYYINITMKILIEIIKNGKEE